MVQRKMQKSAMLQARILLIVWFMMASYAHAQEKPPITPTQRPIVTGPYYPLRQLVYDFTIDSPTPGQLGVWGISMVLLDDLTSDGIDDMAIGAPGENGGHGSIHIVSGADGTPIRTINTPNPNIIEDSGQGYLNADGGQLGWYLARAGDHDGDTLADIVAGAVYEDTTQGLRAGRAYVFSSVDGSVIFEFESPNGEQYGGFGAAVAAVPDTNNDGVIDLAIGANREGVGGTDRHGRAYLFSGTDGSLLHSFVSPTSPANYGEGYFGHQIAGLNDINGDGFGDLVISAFAENGTVNNAGRAYVFSGATGNLLFPLISPTEAEGGRFGMSVISGPDIDSDGIADIVVGAPEEDEIQGVVHIFSGVDGTYLETISSPEPDEGAYFGICVLLDDLNDGGQPEIGIGAPFQEQIYFYSPQSPYETRGHFYIFSGEDRSDLFTVWAAEAREFESGQDGYFGVAAMGPDIDRNGRRDVVIATPYGEVDYSDQGRIYAYTDFGLPLPLINRSRRYFSLENINDAPSEVEVITLGNGWPAPLYLIGPGFEIDDTTHFQLVEQPSLDPIIVGEERREARVIYNPLLPGTHNANLLIHTDDPDYPLFEIELRGTALAAPTSVGPDWILYE